MRVLVTGGAGFIGSNFVLQAREKRPAWDLTVLDALTYAANRSSLQQVGRLLQAVRRHDKRIHHISTDEVYGERKLRTETGWSPVYRDIRAGLAQTIEWYRENEDWWKSAKADAERTYARLGR